jgi:hypothetical protein
MNNPFDQISAAFAPEYRVNLSIERLDGSIMLTLSDSIRLGLAIELGQNPLQVLAALTREAVAEARPFTAASAAN